MIISFVPIARSPNGWLLPEGARDPWEARESRDCMCQGDCLCSRRRLLTHTSLVGRSWGFPHHHRRQRQFGSRSLFVLLHSFFFLSSNGENEGERECLSYLSYPTRRLTRRPTLRLSLNPHYRQAPFFARGKE